jgi:hypothetical protein
MIYGTKGPTSSQHEPSKYLKSNKSVSSSCFVTCCDSEPLPDPSLTVINKTGLLCVAFGATKKDLSLALDMLCRFFLWFFVLN